MSINPRLVNTNQVHFILIACLGKSLSLLPMVDIFILSAHPHGTHSRRYGALSRECFRQTSAHVLLSTQLKIPPKDGPMCILPEVYTGADYTSVIFFGFRNILHSTLFYLLLFCFYNICFFHLFSNFFKCFQKVSACTGLLL